MFLSSRAAYDPREVVWVVVAACVGTAVGTGAGAAVGTGVAASVVVALESLLAGAGVGAAVIAVVGSSVKTSAVVCDVPLTEATTAVDGSTAALLAIIPYRLPNVSIENAPSASVIRFRLRVLTLLISFSLLRAARWRLRNTQASGPGLTFLWSGVKLLQSTWDIDH
jgi:hypothetical protein